MKKILFLIIGGLLLFVILVGVVFGILTFMEKPDSKPKEVTEESAIVSEEDNSVLGFLLSLKQARIDSLLNVAQTFNDSIVEFIAVTDSIDSLNTVMEKQNKSDSLKIVQLLKEADKLKADQKVQSAAATESSANIKELAKTYEQLKINEMKPIFANLDDKTIIDLYNAMSARKKPLVLRALNTERAALITKKLAK